MSETPSNSDKLMTHSYDGPKITELKGQPVRPPTPHPPAPRPPPRQVALAPSPGWQPGIPGGILS